MGEANLHALHMGGADGMMGGGLDSWETLNNIPGGQNYPITCMNCHAGVIHGFGGSAQNKGYRILSAIQAKPATCDPAIDFDFCVDQVDSDEAPYRTSRSRLRVEDRLGWGISGNWAEIDCSAAMDGSGTLAGCRGP